MCVDVVLVFPEHMNLLDDVLAMRWMMWEDGGYSSSLNLKRTYGIFLNILYLNIFRVGSLYFIFFYF